MSLRGFSAAMAFLLMFAWPGSPASAQNPFGDLPSATPGGNAAGNPFDGAPTGTVTIEKDKKKGDKKDSKAEKRPMPAPEADQTVVYSAGENNESFRRIKNALDQRLTSNGFSFVDTPLSEVVNFLRDEYDIEVQIDMQALDDLGLTPEDTITVSLRNISLKSALNIMLKEHDLTAIIADEVLLITTEDEALSRISVRIYPVGDLLQPKTPDSKPESIESLIDAIISTVEADTWCENGGGEADIRSLQPGLLVISQTQRVHDEVYKMLAALRLAYSDPLAQPYFVPDPPPANNQRGGGAFGGGRRGRGGGFGGGSGAQSQQPAAGATNQAQGVSQRGGGAFSIPDSAASYSNSRGERRLRELLLSPLSEAGFHFVDTPLTEVVSFLRSEYKMEVVIDGKALDDLGLTPDETLSATLNRTSLQSALEIVLNQHDLQAIVVDEVLLITSEDEALNIRSSRVYPVGDLLAPKSLGAPHASIHDLLDVIVSMQPLPYWDGEPVHMCPIQPGLLVVNSYDQFQNDLSGLLQALRVARQSPLAVPHRSEPASAFCGG